MTRKQSRQWQAWFLCKLIDRHNLGPGTTPPEVCNIVCELSEEIDQIGRWFVSERYRAWKRAKRKGPK